MINRGKVYSERSIGSLSKDELHSLLFWEGKVVELFYYIASYVD